MSPSCALCARLVAAATLGMLSLTLAVGCTARVERPPRAPASALWLGTGTPPPDAGALAQLRALGVGELFLEAARLTDDAERPIDRLPLPELPQATAVTLVVSGAWRGDTTLEQAEAVAAELGQLRFEAEALGLVPIGIHFELAGVADLAAYARFLRRVGTHLDPVLLRSCSLPRSWLERDDVERVVASVDAVVAFLYGQRASEPENPAAWDFAALEQGLERLDRMKGHYFLGVSTLGIAYRKSTADDVTDQSTTMSLRSLLWDPRLELEPGFSLEGVNRLVYEVRAARPLTVGGWQLAARERVRIVQPASAHIEELTRLSGAWNLTGLLGTVFYRAPHADERLSLEPENLIAALDASPATPDLTLDMRVRRVTGNGLLCRFSVNSHNAEMTELSVLDKNVVRVTAERGSFGRVAAGDFERYGLYERAADGRLTPSFRRAEVVQFHLPILDGGDVATSGDVEIVGADPVLRLEGSFILPDGRTLTLAPMVWRGGRLSPVSDP